MWSLDILLPQPTLHASNGELKRKFVRKVQIAIWTTSIIHDGTCEHTSSTSWVEFRNMMLIRDISKIKKRRICILRISLSHLALWYNHTSLSIRNTSESMLTNQYGFFISLCDLLLALSVVFKPTLKSISLVCHQIDHSIFVRKSC